MWKEGHDYPSDEEQDECPDLLDLADDAYESLNDI
jgi:hypothetical protein